MEIEEYLASLLESVVITTPLTLGLAETFLPPCLQRGKLPSNPIPTPAGDATFVNDD